MSLLRNWSEKVKQNETHDDPATSSSKEHEEEPAERNYLYIFQCFSMFSCSYFVLTTPNTTLFLGEACNILNLSFGLFCVVKKTQQKMKLLFSV